MWRFLGVRLQKGYIFAYLVPGAQFFLEWRQKESDALQTSRAAGSVKRLINSTVGSIDSGRNRTYPLTRPRPVRSRLRSSSYQSA